MSLFSVYIYSVFGCFMFIIVRYSNVYNLLYILKVFTDFYFSVPPLSLSLYLSLPTALFFGIVKPTECLLKFISIPLLFKWKASQKSKDLKNPKHHTSIHDLYNDRGNRARFHNISNYTHHTTRVSQRDITARRVWIFFKVRSFIPFQFLPISLKSRISISIPIP